MIATAEREAAVAEAVALATAGTVAPAAAATTVLIAPHNVQMFAIKAIIREVYTRKSKYLNENHYDGANPELFEPGSIEFKVCLHCLTQGQYCIVQAKGGGLTSHLTPSTNGNLSNCVRQANGSKLSRVRGVDYLDFTLPGIEVVFELRTEYNVDWCIAFEAYYNANKASFPSEKKNSFVKSKLLKQFRSATPPPTKPDWKDEGFDEWEASAVLSQDAPADVYLWLHALWAAFKVHAAANDFPLGEREPEHPHVAQEDLDIIM